MILALFVAVSSDNAAPNLSEALIVPLAAWESEPKSITFLRASSFVPPNLAINTFAISSELNFQPSVEVVSGSTIWRYLITVSLVRVSPLKLIVAVVPAANDVILIPSTIASVNNTAKIFLIFFIFLSPFLLRTLPIFYCPLIWDNNVFVWQEATEKLILTIIFPAPPCICFYIRSIRLRT